MSADEKEKAYRYAYEGCLQGQLEQAKARNSPTPRFALEAYCACLSARMATTWSMAQLGSLPQNRAAVEKESAVCVYALMMQPM